MIDRSSIAISLLSNKPNLFFKKFIFGHVNLKSTHGIFGGGGGQGGLFVYNNTMLKKSRELKVKSRECGSIVA